MRLSHRSFVQCVGVTFFLVLLQPTTTFGQVASESDGRRLVAEQSRRSPRVVAEPGGQRRPIVASDVQFVREVVYATIEQDNAPPIELTMNTAFLKDHSNQLMPAVVLIHGGGYGSGSKEMFNTLLQPLAQGGYFAVTIQYRLSGAAPYPAAVHDCKSAIRFLRANAGDLGIDPTRIGVLGHSAGGHLAALVATTGDDPDLEGNVGEAGFSSAVTCAVDLSGLTDFTLFQRDQPGIRRIFDEWFAGPDATFDERIKQATVLTHVDGDDPPVLIVHGEADRVVSIEHSERLRDSLAKHGVEFEFLSLPEVGHSVARPETAAAVAAFFDKHLGGSAGESMQTFMPEGRASQGGSRRPIPPEPLLAPGKGAASKSGSNDDPEDPEDPEGPNEPTTQPEE